jgi:hypothetical protein
MRLFGRLFIRNLEKEQQWKIKKITHWVKKNYCLIQLPVLDNRGLYVINISHG